MIIDAKFALKLKMNVIKIEQQNKDSKKCDLHKNGVQLQMIVEIMRICRSNK